MMRPLSILFVLAGASSVANAQLVGPSDGASPVVKQVLPSTRSTSSFVQTAVYWTAEAGWHTELHLRNNMAETSLAVTPVVHDSTGREYVLPTINLGAKKGQVIDLHAAIMQSAAMLEGQFGSLDLRYEAPSFRALYAAVMVHRMAKPIDFHVDTFGVAPELISGSREGIWWFPTKGSRDTLVIANKGERDNEVTMTVSRADGTSFAVPVQLPAHGSTRLSVRSLLEARGWTDQFGGIEIRATKDAGYIDTIHFVVDETSGFRLC